ncbi:MAG: hypothetical protein P8R36_01750 [Actinomycetota bacterium]|jgi:hypothetical protein|nr:hypothetical protein [Actinomycetota bacterium]MDG1488987.1 hypothetical protein [Actinomycetota bacterium]MDG2122033.1 hypothetical protein [Actinomycetota bacterium]|tara:strand:- start:943 stop:1617 length:675 start_codon:yes stop_codon:yes gene_type:complete
MPAGSQLQKLELLLCEESGSKKPYLTFQFNPESLSFNQSITLNCDPGSKKDPQSRESMEFSVTAFFDASHQFNPNDSVQLAVEKLYKVAAPEFEKGKDLNPNLVQLQWGKMYTPVSVVSSFGATYTMFDPSGTPIRAEVQLSLTEYDPKNSKPPLQNPTSFTPFPGKLHHPNSGQHLDDVAQELYGDPSGWRRIAAANKISDPFATLRGTRLLVPDEEVFDGTD